ncbi:HlyD family secretion protein [Anaeromyxobacter terrae]|uniref:HlyD family secretion protein n=1 Tax=Anaeromyxobacter terrae TaxID=2925406 RepID=UPI001F57EDD3|nr:HlyD family efflux transporter periplasmic adaptor subunit [Anaeromyxobacter sp. SG22]
MSGVRTGRNAQATVSEAARARRRAAFIASIRQASQAELATTRAEERSRKRKTVEVEVRPRPARATVQTVARRDREPAPEVEQPKPAPRLFRDEALKHRLAYEEGRGLVRVSPPWTWALLWIVVAGLVAALAASFVGQVEVTGRGRGILRPAAGVRALTAQLGGTVTRVEARSGDRLRSGAPLLRIESPAVQAQLLEADRELDAVRTQYSTVSSQQDHHYTEQIESLRARAQRMGEQIASLKGSAALHARRVQADLGLLGKGLLSEMAVAESRDGLAQAERQLSAAEQTLDQTRQELASLESRRQEELWNRQQLVATAQNKRDALALVLQQSVIQAPDDGTVELLVKPGEVIQPGQVVAKLVPVDSPLQGVSFLAERDRAFAKAGDEVQLELDQLPHAQYGTVRARVTRISDDLASPAEIRDALGDEQRNVPPSYRVELEITDAAAAEAAHVKLRTGALLNARFTLRRQRLVTLVLKPLQRWLP